MSEKLKPCPFCGREKVSFLYDIDTGEPKGVMCSWCKVIVRWPTVPRMKTQETFGDQQKRLTERWNERG